MGYFSNINLSLQVRYVAEKRMTTRRNSNVNNRCRVLDIFASYTPLVHKLIEYNMVSTTWRPPMLIIFRL